MKTTNSGSLYRLTYYLTRRRANSERELIDQLRCRNGNLNIVCGRISTIRDKL